jgi:hypothetical protein
VEESTSSTKQIGTKAAKAVKLIFRQIMQQKYKNCDDLEDEKEEVDEEQICTKAAKAMIGLFKKKWNKTENPSSPYPRA